MRGRAPVLFMVGFRAGRRPSAGATVHRWALTLAAAATVLGCCLFIAISVVAAAGEARVAAREPVYVQAGGDASAAARWMIHSDYADNHQFMVLYIAPLRDGVSPPPGLPRWPEPGEVFLSPSLVDGAQPIDLKRRFGTFGGTIGRSGLSDPSERLAYYRPLTDRSFEERQGPVEVSGFGVDPDTVPGGYFPHSLVGFGKWTATDLFVLAALVVLLPLAVLVLLAVRSNSERRDRRLAMLDALGAPRLARMWVLLGEAAAPVVSGAVIGCVLASVLTLWDLRVPLTGYVAPAADLAGVRVFVPVVGVLVALGILALVVLVQLRGRAAGEARPRTINARFDRAVRVVFPVSLGTAVWGATTARADAGADYSIGLIVFLVSVVVVLAALPTVLGAATAGAGRQVARLGAVTGSPGMIVGGRWLRARPALVARLCAAFVVGLGLLVQVQIEQTWIVHQSQGASTGTLSAGVRPGERLVVIRTAATAGGAAAFTAAVGRDNVVSVSKDDVLRGSCAAFRTLGRLQRCPDAPMRMREAFASVNATGLAVSRNAELTAPDVRISTAAAPRVAVSGFFVVNDDGAAGVEAVGRAAYANLTKPYVSTAGQELIGGGLEGAAVFDWVLSFGVLGLVVLALAGALAAGSMFLSQAASLGVLGTYEARHRLYLTIATWNLGLPLIVAAVVGSAIAMFLGWLTLTMRRTGGISYDVLGAGFATVCVMAVLLTVVCGVVATRSVRRWRPAAD